MTEDGGVFRRCFARFHNHFFFSIEGKLTVRRKKSYNTRITPVSSEPGERSLEKG